MAVVSLVDRDRQWFKSRQGVEVDETPRHFSFCTHTIQQDKPLIVPDTLADQRFCNSPLVTQDPHIRSYLGIPLRTPNGFNIGALCINDVAPREITSTQVEILHELARLVMDELELRRLASVDSLTGAITRRAFDLSGDRMLDRLRTMGTPLSCILIDIDGFKAINDDHGHAIGDLALCAIVRACHNHAGGGAVAGRIGGDEFAILLEGVQLEEATEVAATIQQTWSKDLPVSVTACVGVAQLVNDDAILKDLLKRAGINLYAAKERLEGRPSAKDTSRAA
jgi:diguanylate cyclase (GGDEF)-like protein